MRVDMCIDMCIDMRADMRIDMRIDMRVDMRIDMRINMRIDMRIDMCIGMCMVYGPSRRMRGMPRPSPRHSLPLCCTQKSFFGLDIRTHAYRHVYKHVQAMGIDVHWHAAACRTLVEVCRHRAAITEMHPTQIIAAAAAVPHSEK